MTALNLPPFKYRLKEAEGKRWIFDSIRKKFVVLTPEEWVRQHVVHYLISDLHYPRALIKIEGGLTYNQLAKRTDIVVYDRNGKPWMVVECKAPSVKLNEQVIYQAAMYNSKLAAKYVVISNGLVQATCRINNNGIDVLDSIPVYEPGNEVS